MGTAWFKSGSLELDNNGVPAVGAVAYFFEGGTTTPLTVYEDGDESTPHEHPLETDGNGRWPLVLVPYTETYDFKIVTSSGLQLVYYQELPNPAPIESEADEDIDDENLVLTGHVHWEPIAGTKTGYVRCNGRTIGDASSGGAERANADTSDLFTYLWNGLANSQAAVSGGRGASAAADYAAHKTIALPDLRFGAIFGLDDMGNSAAGRSSNVPFGHGTSTTAGSAAGQNNHTITEAQLPSHTHTVSGTTDSGGAHTHTATTSSDGSHTHTHNAHSHQIDATSDGVQAGGSFNTINLTAAAIGVGGADQGDTENATTTESATGAHTHTLTTSSDGAHTHTFSSTSGATGSGTAMNNLSYGLLGTFYIKL